MKCPVCQKSLTNNAALNDHIKAKHPNVVLSEQPAIPSGEAPDKHIITVELPRMPPGFHKINCPLCGSPADLNVKSSDAIPQIQKPLEQKDKFKSLPTELPAVIAARMEQRLGKKTVVMIGTHPESLGKTPWNEAGIDEFWALNDAVYLEPMAKNMSKISRWFQFHHRWRFTRRNARYEADHWAWLQENHDDLQVVMQRHFTDVPNSTKYPLREVCDLLLGTTIGRGAGYQLRYFTSTFAYMLALVMYEKKMGIHDWERVELYGCELVQIEEEYFKQRPGLEYWIGRCNEAGIQIYVPEFCRIMTACDVQKTGVHPQFGYNSYGYMEPSLGSAMQQGLPIGEDPTEENLIGAWEDAPIEFVRGRIKGLFFMESAANMSTLDDDLAKLWEAEPLLAEAVGVIVEEVWDHDRSD